MINVSFADTGYTTLDPIVYLCLTVICKHVLCIVQKQII